MPLSDAFDASIYKEALLFLATAGIVAPLFFRLRLSPVLGYLLAGVALGPQGLGRLAGAAPWLDALALRNVDAIDRVAAFGVVFLLFAMGLELSFERLKSLRRLVFGFGLAQVAASTLLLGAAAYALGQSPKASFAIGAALSLSSTAIVIPLLAERKRMNSLAGRLSFAVLLCQDLAVAPLLFMASALASHDSLGPGLVFALAPAALALAGAIFLGRFALRPLFQSVALTRSPEFFMAACLLVVLGAALITARAGLSMALGAFVAGLLLAETEYRREIEVTIAPFRGLLLGLFFVSVGAELDVATLLARPLQILALVAGLLLTKAIVVVVLGRLFALAGDAAGEAALLLAPAGEFAFVIIGAAAAGKLIDPVGAASLSVVSAMTMMGLPLLARLGVYVAARPSAPQLPPEALEPPSRSDAPRVIIAGFGRVGALVGQLLDMHQIPFIAIDDDVRLIARERRAGRPVFFGDAARSEFLRNCGIETARALIVTMDDAEANEHIVIAARLLRPDLTLVSRARDADHAQQLYALGVTDAVPETIEASLQLAEAALVDIGVPMGLVIASIHEKRDEIRKLLASAGAPPRARDARRTRKPLT